MKIKQVWGLGASAAHSALSAAAKRLMMGVQGSDGGSRFRWGFKVQNFRVLPFVACGLRFVGYGLQGVFVFFVV